MPTPPAFEWEVGVGVVYSFEAPLLVLRVPIWVPHLGALFVPILGAPFANILALEVAQAKKLVAYFTK